MYRCELCGECSKAGQGRLLHVIQRTVKKLGEGTRQEIAKEIPICTLCNSLLKTGVPLDKVIILRKLDQEREADGSPPTKKKSKYDWTDMAVALRGSAKK